MSVPGARASLSFVSLLSLLVAMACTVRLQRPMIDSLPQLFGGRYQLIRLLRRGGMGSVYEVEHAHTGEHFALKLLRDHSLADELALERFRREARVSACIKSEHVVRVIDADVAPELDGAPYLVMELLEGEDLGRACGDTPQRADRVIDWLRQVTKALDKAHSLGIVHRDLKPENLFLTRREDGTSMVKILDFGLAKVILDRAASTASGEMLGTPLFMAPEQAELEARRVTPKADLFALGLIAHKLLTGRNYWSAQLFVQLVREICLEPMPPPSQRGSMLGAGFDAWFARACHRDPDQRFETGSAQIEALAAAGVAEHAAAGFARTVSSKPRPSRTFPTLRAGQQEWAKGSTDFSDTLRSRHTTISPAARQKPSGGYVVDELDASSLHRTELGAGVARPIRVGGSTRASRARVMAQGDDPIHVEQSGDYAFGTWHHMMVVVWKRETTIPAVRRIEGSLYELAKERGGKIELLSIVENGALLPTPEARKATAEVLRGGPIKLSGMVIEGEGFRAAAVRGVITGIGFLAKTPYPHRTFASVEDAAEWIEKETGDDGSRALTRDRIVRAVGSLRRQA